MSLRNALVLLLAVALGAALGFYLVDSRFLKPAQPQIPPAVGMSAPDFTLNSLNSDPLQLSELRGKAVVINFWATWCAPCRDEMPMLDLYARRYPDQLIILGVNYLESTPTVQEFQQQQGLTFPLLLDPSGAAAHLYFARSFPTTFFIDDEGIIRAQHMGLLTEEQLNRYLQTIGIQ